MIFTLEIVIERNGSAGLGDTLDNYTDLHATVVIFHLEEIFNIVCFHSAMYTHACACAESVRERDTFYDLIIHFSAVLDFSLLFHSIQN